MIDRIVVSHKSDHGALPKAGLRGQTAGQLHNDTAYGFTGQTDSKGNTIVVRRKMLSDLGEKDIAAIRDHELRTRLLSSTRDRSGTEFKNALLNFTKADQKFAGIRRVRVTEPLSVIPISNAEGKTYKGYKGDANFRFDVWELKDGKWVAEVITMFDAHRAGWTSPIRESNPTARKVLSLHQNDMVAYEHPGGGHTIGLVVKFGVNGQVTLVPHKETSDLKRRDALPQDVDPFKYYSPTAGGLKKIKLRQVRVDETGRVFDPGPQDRESRLARMQKGAG